MKHLTLIANKNCTDKGTSYREAHGFTEIYEDYIKKFIGKHPRILEIGIENGGSLKMWNDYFLGDCEIYAIDILPEKKMFETENTHIFIQDQGSREDWENFKAQVGCGCKDFFDIILDDGSHFPEHQMITLYELCDCVKKDGGIYILDDLHSNISKDVFFLDGRSYEDTPLFSLVFKEYSPFLSEPENAFLFSKLNDVNLYSFHNYRGSIKNRSVTSIINFKEN